MPIVHASAPPRPARAPDLADLVARYDGRAPRYTSYPTAVQFTAAVDTPTYRDWLAALPADEPVSIYIHIPFCGRLCWYCGCNTRAVTRHGPIGDYVNLLLDELHALADALPARLPVQAIHLGGGTPNMLTPYELSALFGALRTEFALADDAEIAAELDPATLTRGWVEAAARLGLNRASLGVQILDPKVQAAVNRHETFDEIAAGVGWLRAAGVSSVNLDLMYGLPHQSVDNTLETIEAVLRLRPERIALFGYAHVPWMKAHQKLIPEAALPDGNERIAQAEAAADRLMEAGYVRIGLDHFARPDDALAEALTKGSVHRNFQGYTTDAAQTLLGLGASAIGRLPQGYVQNATQEVAWRDAVKAGGLAVVRGVALTDDDLFRGEIIERLMCDLQVDLAAVCARHGRRLSDLDGAIRALGPALQDHLVDLKGARLRVIGDGRLVVRSICAAFDAYFEPAAGRHSKAI